MAHQGAADVLIGVRSAKQKILQIPGVHDVRVRRKIRRDFDENGVETQHSDKWHYFISISSLEFGLYKFVASELDRIQEQHPAVEMDYDITTASIR